MPIRRHNKEHLLAADLPQEGFREASNDAKHGISHLSPALVAAVRASLVKSAIAATGFPPTGGGPPRSHKPYVIHVYSRQTMVGGAAEPRLQATHRDRCTDSRARMSPRGVDSLASSLNAREGRPLAGAGALRSSLDGRWLGL